MPILQTANRRPIPILVYHQIAAAPPKGSPFRSLYVAPGAFARQLAWLKRLGYRVLAASNPGDAIRLAEKKAGEIDLLLTDVVMPGMNGRDLDKHLRSLQPHFKTLFMSGYTADIIAHRGVLDEGVAFIEKPFAKKDLAAKLRGLLE